VNGLKKTVLLNLERVDRVYPSNSSGDASMVAQGDTTISVMKSFREMRALCVKAGQLHAIDGGNKEK
jgi:hypothetical protein